jgi:2-polyprenyl-3-methyl-5-hydroxy-6-metoxy-1,4-benzoquinol methylase
MPYDRPVDWQKPYDTLRAKWIDIPTTNSEIFSTEKLLALPDDALLAKWEHTRKDTTTGAGFDHRGWYQILYAEGMRGKKVMDIGCGFAVDSITFAQHGARVTFVDLAETNLKVVQRLCGILGLRDVHFQHFKDLNSLRGLDTDYDVIMGMGSLHNAPVEVMKPEYQELLRHLRVGGRWLQLAYPKSLWIKHGRPGFDEWGAKLEHSPWEEWYDVPKLLSMFEPAKFDVVLYHEFHNGDFNWFDLLYRGK